MSIFIKSKEEISGVRKAGKIAALSFEKVESYLREGITTEEISNMVEDSIRSHNARAAFKGYRGFPAPVCISINEEVVHGIPNQRKLKNGDIVGIDIGVEKDGLFADTAKTFGIGEIKPEVKRLLEVTEKALYSGIEIAKEGNRVSDISYVIQSYVESAGFSIVEELTGHGVGLRLHEEPQIPNFGPPHKGARLVSGMILAIEPMVNMGGKEVKILKDGWTVVTVDSLPSAHFEHTVLVDKDSPVILTRS